MGKRRRKSKIRSGRGGGTMVASPPPRQSFAIPQPPKRMNEVAIEKADTPALILPDQSEPLVTGGKPAAPGGDPPAAQILLLTHRPTAATAAPPLSKDRPDKAAMPSQPPEQPAKETPFPSRQRSGVGDGRRATWQSWSDKEVAPLPRSRSLAVPNDSLVSRIKGWLRDHMPRRRAPPAGPSEADLARKQLRELRRQVELTERTLKRLG